VGNGSFGVVFQVNLFIFITRLQFACLWRFMNIHSFLFIVPLAING
jgi:hypothetical protein